MKRKRGLDETNSNQGELPDLELPISFIGFLGRRGDLVNLLEPHGDQPIAASYHRFLQMREAHVTRLANVYLHAQDEAAQVPISAEVRAAAKRVSIAFHMVVDRFQDAVFAKAPSLPPVFLTPEDARTFEPLPPYLLGELILATEKARSGDLDKIDYLPSIWGWWDMKHEHKEMWLRLIRASQVFACRLLKVDEFLGEDAPEESWSRDPSSIRLLQESSKNLKRIERAHGLITDSVNALVAKKTKKGKPVELVIKKNAPDMNVFFWDICGASTGQIATLLSKDGSRPSDAQVRKKLHEAREILLRPKDARDRNLK